MTPEDLEGPPIASRIALRPRSCPGRPSASLRRITFATGFGAEGCVLIDLVARHRLPIDLFTLDTGLLFPETYALWRRLEARYGVVIRAVRPLESVEEQARSHGDRLWERDPDACCGLRKVEPLRSALRGFDAWITAIRRDQTPERASAGIIERDSRYGLVKVNPLAAGRAPTSPPTSATTPSRRTRSTIRAIRASAACRAPAASSPGKTPGPGAGAAAPRPNAGSTPAPRTSGSRRAATEDHDHTLNLVFPPRRLPRGPLRDTCRGRCPEGPRRSSPEAGARPAGAGRSGATRHGSREPAHGLPGAADYHRVTRGSPPRRRHRLAAALTLAVTDDVRALLNPGARPRSSTTAAASGAWSRSARSSSAIRSRSRASSTAPTTPAIPASRTSLPSSHARRRTRPGPPPAPGPSVRPVPLDTLAAARRRSRRGAGGGSPASRRGTRSTAPTST